MSNDDSSRGLSNVDDTENYHDNASENNARSDGESSAGGSEKYAKQLAEIDEMRKDLDEECAKLVAKHSKRKTKELSSSKSGEDKSQTASKKRVRVSSELQSDHARQEASDGGTNANKGLLDSDDDDGTTFRAFGLVSAALRLDCGTARAKEEVEEYNTGASTAVLLKAFTETLTAGHHDLVVIANMEKGSAVITLVHSMEKVHGSRKAVGRNFGKVVGYQGKGRGDRNPVEITLRETKTWSLASYDASDDATEMASHYTSCEDSPKLWHSQSKKGQNQRSSILANANSLGAMGCGEASNVPGRK